MRKTYRQYPITLPDATEDAPWEQVTKDAYTIVNIALCLDKTLAKRCVGVIIYHRYSVAALGKSIAYTIDALDSSRIDGWKILSEHLVPCGGTDECPNCPVEHVDEISGLSGDYCIPAPDDFQTEEGWLYFLELHREKLTEELKGRLGV